MSLARFVSTLQCTYVWTAHCLRSLVLSQRTAQNAGILSFDKYNCRLRHLEKKHTNKIHTVPPSRIREKLR